MCGIVGGVFFGPISREEDRVSSFVEQLMRAAGERGQDASGIAINTSKNIYALKKGVKSSRLLDSPEFKEAMQEAREEYRSDPALPSFSFIGHSRLATNGGQTTDLNNQPVLHESMALVHNGIIVNYHELWKSLGVKEIPELDSAVIAGLFADKNPEKDPVRAFAKALCSLEGSFAVAAFPAQHPFLFLGTNTGSLFVAESKNEFVVFASEQYILESVLRSLPLDMEHIEFSHVEPGTMKVIELGGHSSRDFKLSTATEKVDLVPKKSKNVFAISHEFDWDSMKRCKKCILPDTHPLIEIDAEGICYYCRNYKPTSLRPHATLEKTLDQYRSKDGSPDCIVAFSGGRDSAYGLHLIKTKYEMNPVAFTYDWGMVTDLARRNQARICGKLGVEHIIRSADIVTKRRYIRKNVEAWLKRPELGIMTLFTAGDKEFYHYARKLRKETGIKLVVFCTGNMLEDTPYKTGFCGFRESDHGMTLTGVSLWNKILLLKYFAKEALLNPRYFNESLIDSIFAYYSTFVAKDDFLYLYHYVEWNEQQIVSTIRKEYDWEVAKDTLSTWRIGDATAAFYNYVYQMIAGFNEDEVMLSNMIRSGYLTRQEAIQRAKMYAPPRWDSIREYLELCGLSFTEVINAIQNFKKMYHHRQVKAVGVRAAKSAKVA